MSDPRTDPRTERAKGMIDGLMDRITEIEEKGPYEVGEATAICEDLLRELGVWVKVLLVPGFKFYINPDEMSGETQGVSLPCES